MRKYLILLLFLFSITPIWSQTRTVHLFVALCDNQYQGIVKVPAGIGNGQDARNNLYWGAGYGVKTFFSKKSNEWKLVSTLPSPDPRILERLLFKHTTKDVYLLADAWDGKFIQNCTENFLLAANAQGGIKVQTGEKELDFGGNSDMLAYIGHDGLMDFEVEPAFVENTRTKPETIILACFSKKYFSPLIQQAGATPLLWTTHFMAPEAYSLEAALNGWVRNETPAQIEERAAQAYNLYQKCGMKGARGLFCTGF